MPLPTKIKKEVRNVAARNLIAEGDYLMVSLRRDEPLVLHSDLSDEQWIDILIAINHHIGISTFQQSIKYLRGALARERLKQQQHTGG